MVNATLFALQMAPHFDVDSMCGAAGAANDDEMPSKTVAVSNKRSRKARSPAREPNAAGAAEGEDAEPPKKKGKGKGKGRASRPHEVTGKRHRAKQDTDGTPQAAKKKPRKRVFNVVPGTPSKEASQDMVRCRGCWLFWLKMHLYPDTRFCHECKSTYYSCARIQRLTNRLI